MQRLLHLSPTLTVSDQITVADLPALAAQGVHTLICNRPDHEELGQPTSGALKAAAAALGMHYVDQPVSYSMLRAEDGDAFAAQLANAPGKVHAFCRSGRRSVALWALASVKALGTHGTLEAAARVGEDLRGLAPLLSEIEAK